MKFSYLWLRELSGTKKSPEKLSELLMAHAFEVESVEVYAHGLDGVVIGKVESVEQHPNADRLRVATVNTGKKNIQKIVCGAPNLAVGQKVAVALPGAQLPGGIVIKEAELRGVTSRGMICSAKELGLGTDHTGILVLPADAPLGKDFTLYAELTDTVLDVKILPDRSSDALSYQGLAHEIAALEGMEAAFLSTPAKRLRLHTSSKVPKVSIKTERCFRYLALLVENVATVTTPLAVQSRLIVSGLRPVSAVVDLTNYLMLETGQPIHAFDADAIPKGGIVIRQAKSRERLTLLDGTVLALNADDMVIADLKKPLALAGVMGGQHSGISEKTTSVLFEVASFDAKSIRRTEKRHRLLTDAAYRFERGIDIGRPGEIAPLLATFLTDWGIGKNALLRDTGHSKQKEVVIVLELESVERLLGTKIPLFEVVQYFSWLGLSVKKVPNRPALRVTVPIRRPDLREPEDLIEEIGRLRGYHRIIPVAPLRPMLPVTRDPMKAFERMAKTTLIASGFDEIMTYSFYSEKALALTSFAKEEHLSLANPMNPDQALMRTSLLPNLYRAALLNTKQFSRFQFFEFGSIFRLGKTSPDEEKQIGLVMVDHDKRDAAESFLAFKGSVVAFLQAMDIRAEWKDVVAGVSAFWHPTRVAHLFVDGAVLGTAGELAPEHARRLGSGTHFYYAELSVMNLVNRERGEALFRDFSRFPLAHRDISLIGPRDISFASLQMALREAGAPLLVSSELFDVYAEGEEKSFALHLAFGSPDWTLGGDEIDRAFDAIVRAAGEKLGMRLKLVAEK